MNRIVSSLVSSRREIDKVVTAAGISSSIHEWSALPDNSVRLILHVPCADISCIIRKGAGFRDCYLGIALLINKERTVCSSVLREILTVIVPSTDARGAV